MLISNILFTFIVVIALDVILVRVGSLLRVFDHPNVRSLHNLAVPRTGGIAMLAGILVSSALSREIGFYPLSETKFYLLLGLTPLVIISFLDDCRNIAAKWRILIHLLASVSLLAAGLAPGNLELPDLTLPLVSWVAIFITLLFGGWMINLYNFMDGIDGFAGGMTLIGFSTLAWLGRADATFTDVCLIVAAASAGFLIHNFPPAKIFMGDTGSTALGFLAAACTLWGSKANLFPLWIAILVFSPFIVDATVTLLRRLLRGEKVWQAHRSHYYQRLVLLGWGHRRTVLAEYVLMLACAGSAVLAMELPPAGQTWLLVIWVFIYSLLIWGVGRLERRHATVSAP